MTALEKKEKYVREYCKANNIRFRILKTVNHDGEIQMYSLITRKFVAVGNLNQVTDTNELYIMLERVKNIFMC